MTNEERELLLKDLCARLPYGVKVKYVFDDGSHCPFELSIKILQECLDKGFIPYLRPMSSMTEEERAEFQDYVFESNEIGDIIMLGAEDWLNAHYFDYRGLIEKGLAIEVTPENNPYK